MRAQMDRVKSPRPCRVDSLNSERKSAVPAMHNHFKLVNQPLTAKHHCLVSSNDATAIEWVVNKKIGRTSIFCCNRAAPLGVGQGRWRRPGRSDRVRQG